MTRIPARVGSLGGALSREGLHRLPLPQFLYGTAWKEKETERLTGLAIKSGFRAIDTANQRKHYVEAGVGRALAKLWDKGHCTREALFLQTKYTFPRGQDERLPYDPKADVMTQVHQSFHSSLKHLKTAYLDSFILHGPSTKDGLVDEDYQAWRAMEELYDEGEVHHLGVSNVSSEQLEELLRNVRVKPSFVQNRCYAKSGWDAVVQEICMRQGMRYQGFSLLTANREELMKPAVRAISSERNATMPQIVFAFARQIGMIPLTGTSSETHMREDLESLQLQLSREELLAIAKVGLVK